MRRRRIALGIGANLIDQGALVAIQLLTVALLVRFWGAAGFGTWAMLTAIPAMLALGDLGFGAAAGTRMTMELARGEDREAARTLRAAIRVIAGAAVVIALVVLASAALGQAWLSGALPELGPGERALLPAALGAYAVAVLFSGLSQALFRSTGRFAQGMVLSTFTNCLESALLFAAAAAGWGMASAAAAWAGGRLCGVVLQWLIAARGRPDLTRRWWTGSGGRVGELIGPAMAAVSVPLSRTLLLQGTVIALGAVAGAAVVPAFVAARTLSRIGLQGAQLLTTALMPEFGAAAAQDDRRAVQRMVVLVAATGAAIALPFAAFLALAGPWVIGLWSGGAIAASAALMLVMAVSALCGGIWNPLSNLVLAINRQSAFAGVYAVVAAAGVGLTLVLAGSLGAVAAALALVLADAVMLGLMARFVRRTWLDRGAGRPVLRELLGEARTALAGRIGRRG